MGGAAGPPPSGGGRAASDLLLLESVAVTPTAIRDELLATNDNRPGEKAAGRVAF